MKVEKTTNYNIFKRVESNRETKHRKKLISSVDVVGQIAPIIVDKDMRVVDGQHRLEALKALGMPVYYIINPDVNGNIEELIQHANINSVNWKIDDWIHFWAAKGKRQYQELQTFHRESKFNLATILSVCGNYNNDAVMSGELVFDKNKTETRLKMLEDFRGFEKYKHVYFVRALSIVFSTDGYNHQHMKTKLAQRVGTILPADTKNYLRQLQEVYNFRTRKEDKLSFLD